MPLGTCPECGALVAIVPRGYATPRVVSFRGRSYLGQNPRALAWFPVPHDRPADVGGGPCGSKKEC